MGPTVLRAPDTRGRAGGRPPGEAHRRHRAVRRADAAQAGRGLEKAGIRILGTSVDAIDAAEDRELWSRVVEELKLAPAGKRMRAQPRAGARDRPPHRLPGHGPSQLRAGRARHGGRPRRRGAGAVLHRGGAGVGRAADPHRPVLNDATEVDVDCVGDGKDYVVAGVMEHIEEAGIHSATPLAPCRRFSLPKEIVAEDRAPGARAGEAPESGRLHERAFAVQGHDIYVLEANPRASPAPSRSWGRPPALPWAKIAALCTVGRSLAEQGIRGTTVPKHLSVKEGCSRFHRFSKADTILGPEMRSTGEVMGLDDSFPVLRQGPDRRGQRAAAAGPGVHLGARRRQGGCGGAGSAPLEARGSRSSPPAGTAELFRSRGVPSRRCSRSPRAGRTSWTS